MARKFKYWETFGAIFNFFEHIERKAVRKYPSLRSKVLQNKYLQNESLQTRISLELNHIKHEALQIRIYLEVNPFKHEALRTQSIFSYKYILYLKVFTFYGIYIRRDSKLKGLKTEGIH